MLSFLILFLFCQFSLNQSDNQIKTILPIRPRAGEDTTNDTLLEIFQNCRCVIYYQCDENNNIITDGTGLFDLRIGETTERVTCTQDLYYCCRESGTVLPATTDKPRETLDRAVISTTSTTTPSPEPKNPQVISQDGSSQQLFVNTDKKKLHCGKQRTLIDMRIFAEGEDVSSTIVGEMPWIVSVFQNNNGQHKFKCGGTLINAQIVLTATHCIRSAQAADITVIASGSNTFQEIGIDSNVERSASKLIKHPNYYSGGLHNDIGLIVLSEPYNLSAHPINTICLASMDDNFEGQRCWAAGWGGNDKDTLSKVLRKVELPVISNSKCQDLLRKTRLGEEFELHESFLCAGGEKGRGTCYGDGGGPLICLKDSRYYQAGIVSWGVSCKQADQPEVFTDVRKFKNWIEDLLKGLNFF